MIANTRAALIGTIMAAGVSLSATSAMAKTVSINGHDAAFVKARCGGVFWPTGPDTATYGCMNKDGSGVVCGGVTDEQKKTCSTFFVARASGWRLLRDRLSARDSDHQQSQPAK